MKHHILIVAGRSGSGKTTLAKSLAQKIGCQELGFSYAGRELAKLEKESEEFRQIEEYVYNCITNALNDSQPLIIDGLASEAIYTRLEQNGHQINVIFVDTPERIRIQRIAEREGCSKEEAEFIEAIKEKGKAKSGLAFVIGKADITIDGEQKKDVILDQALQYYRNGA